MATTISSAGKSRNLPSVANLVSAFERQSFKIMTAAAVITFVATLAGAEIIAAVAALITMFSLRFQISEP